VGVVPDRCGQRQDALRDADGGALSGCSVVVFMLVYSGIVCGVLRVDHQNFVILS
jgi:hypothetical protein